jgi:hypothetical protein
LANVEPAVNATTRHSGYSLLQTGRLRPLPVALAHQFAMTKSSDPYRIILARLYDALPSAQQAQCRAELDRTG